MTNRKTTRRALVLSLLSLLLCCSMLVGTTFAWFTDSVQSGNNQIIAGNLDVELNYSNTPNGTYESVLGVGDVFVAPAGTTKGLWEPGHTEVAYLQIHNAGTLNLKYQLRVVPAHETVGVTEDGKEIKLSKILKFAATEPVADPIATAYDRQTAQQVALNGNGTALTEYSKDVPLLAPGKSHYVALVVYMPETVGNEANHKTGTAAPTIDFSLNLVATQVEAEYDSFGQDYDKNSEYLPKWDGSVTPIEPDANGVYHVTTGAELAYVNTLLEASGVETGIKVSLDVDLNLANLPWTPIGPTTAESGVGKRFEGTFEGNGHTIYNLSVGAASTFSLRATNTENAGLFGVTANATISNLHISGATVSGTERVGALVGMAQSSKIINCSVNNVTVSGESKVGGLIGDLVSSTVTESKVDNATLMATKCAGGLVGRTRADGVAPAVSACTVTNTTIAADSEADYLVGQQLVAVDTSSSSWNNVIISNGSMIAPGVVEVAAKSYEITGKEGLLNANELIAETSTGEGNTIKIKLLADIDLTGETWKPIDKMWVEFDGNGHTISNLTANAWKAGLFGYLGGGVIKNLTLENVNVTGAQAGTFAGAAEGRIENCTLKGNNTVTWEAKHQFDDPNSNLETWGGIGAITGVMQPMTVNATIAEGATVTLNYGGIVTEAPYVDQLTGYIAANQGTVTNNGKIIVGASDTASLINAIAMAPDGQKTEIALASGTYTGDIDLTVEALGQKDADLVIKAAEGATPVIAGTVTLGYRNQGVGATMWNSKVTFEGVTFDHAEAGKHSLDVQDVKSVTLRNCTIIGDGEYGITSARGNGTGTSKIEGCTFKNAGMQLLGNFATGLVIEGCTFEESRINIQAGNGVTVQKCNFKNTLTNANVDDSFYLIRTRSTPITVKDCKANIDSTLTEVATNQAEWYLLANRGTTNWTVEDVEITMTDAALAQTALKVTACTSTGAINTTNLTVNGVVK